MASSILLSGNNFSKIALFCTSFNLQHIKTTTFYQVQRHYLCPTIESYWNEQKGKILSAIGDKPLVVSGDGRNDSPGFSAQYCLYSVMDNETNCIIEVQVVDKREVDLKSVRMEKLGLQRALAALKGTVNIVELVTDASTSIAAMMCQYLTVSHNLF